jgi:hypothetical protein
LNEAALSNRIGNFIDRKDLDRDWALQAGVLSLVDETHRAFADLRPDSIVLQYRAPRQHQIAAPMITGRLLTRLGITSSFRVTASPVSSTGIEKGSETHRKS